MAGILLDTHIVIWFAEGDNRLSESARSIITDPANSIFVSIVSLWEIVIKSSLGKLPFNRATEDVIKFFEFNGIQLLKMEAKHLDTLQSLPHYHKDPFDRLLISQAISESLSIVSADQYFNQYPLLVVY